MGSIYRRRYKTADGTIKESPTLWIKYFRDGKSYRESAGTSKEGEAKRLLKLREGDAARGVPIVPRAGRVKFRELAQGVEDDYRINGKRTLRDLKMRLRLHLLPYFGECRADSITTATINKYAALRQEQGAANGSINRELAIVKRAYSLAQQAGTILHGPHVPRLKESKPRAGFFERDRFEVLQRHLPPTLRRVATFSYLTGWRVPSEVLKLQWRQVDFQTGIVTLDPGTTKHEEGRVFYLRGELLETLRAQRAVTEEAQRRLAVIIPWVWHRSNGERIQSFTKAWKTACRLAGIPGSNSARLQENGGPTSSALELPESVAIRLTGHKTRSVFERYNVTSSTDLKNAADVLDRFHNPHGHDSGHNSGLRAQSKEVESL